MVEAVAWRLSPNRGTLVSADECDALAYSDLYGLGPGIYPVDSVPVSPHPWDRCERVPITRDLEKAGAPKPRPKPVDGAKIEFGPNGRGLSASRAKRLRQSVNRHVALTDRLKPDVTNLVNAAQEETVDTSDLDAIVQGEVTNTTLRIADLESRTAHRLKKLDDEYAAMTTRRDELRSKLNQTREDLAEELGVRPYSNEVLDHTTYKAVDQEYTKARNRVSTLITRRQRYRSARNAKAREIL